MSSLALARILFGVALSLLGLLWLLQGADLVHIRPILCVANCKPLEGDRSAGWQRVRSCLLWDCWWLPRASAVDGCNMLLCLQSVLRRGAAMSWWRFLRLDPWLATILLLADVRRAVC
jgi:hypothetical protein